jgi:hypothetical protein
MMSRPLGFLLYVSVTCCLFAPAFAQTGINVTTYHNDNARTGQNLSESILTPATVKTSQFGKIFSQAVDGYVYAQPLYVSGLKIGGVTHNVVYVATEHDSVYAFDADNNKGANYNPLWKVSFINPAQGITTVDSLADIGCGDLVPEVGITGTPVIDLDHRVLYLVAKTKENGLFFQRLHALDLITGAERQGSPVTIQASVAGAGEGAVNGVVSFDAFKEAQRPGLALVNGFVYISWASHCDFGPYHGWTLAYDASSLQLVGVWNATAYGRRGGVWQGGAAPAIDTDGNLFEATGNGTFNVTAPSPALGDSVVKLGLPISMSLPVLDSFTPYNQNSLNAFDADLGSGGVLLLPDLAMGSAHPHLLVQSGKQGTIYLLDRDKLGGFNPAGNSQIVQEIAGANNGIWGMPGYWNNNIYFGAQSDVLKAFSFNAGNSGLLSTTPTSTSSQVYGYPGPTPSISANGAGNGIVWVLQSDAYSYAGYAVLHAYDATNLANELYNSGQNMVRDNPGGAVKFAVPTIANGKVYVGAVNKLTVFGPLAPAAGTPSFSLASGVYPTTQTVALSTTTAGAEIHYTIDGSTPTTSSPIYKSPLTIAATRTVRALAAATGYSVSPVASALYTIETKATGGPNYLSGFSATGLTFNGSAVLNGTRLQLTARRFGEAGSAFFNTPVSATAFTTDFTFQLTDAVADGMTFCIQNSGLTALGYAGGSLGYDPSIGYSVAIKFDLYNNSGEGVNSTGIYTDGQFPGVPSIDLTPTGIDLHSGHVFYSRLQYSGVSLTQELLDVNDPTKYFRTVYTIDIGPTVGGGSAYAGFTAGTGGLVAKQEILTWNLF